MKYYDLNIGFEIEKNALRKLGYEKALLNAKGIRLLSSPDKEKMRKNLRKFDLICLEGYAIDPGIIRIAQQHEKVFEIPISYLLERSGVERGKMLRKIRLFLYYCMKYNVDFAFTSRAHSIWELKTPRELIGIGSLLGVPRDKVVYSISKVPEKILSLSRIDEENDDEKLSGNPC